MKIAQLIIRFHPAVGGAEEHVLEISKRLVRDGHEVTVYTSDLESEEPWKRLKQKPSKHKGIKIKRFKAQGTLYPRLTGLKIDGCDLIHAHSMPKSYTDHAAIYSRKTKTSLIISTVGLHFHKSPRKRNIVSKLKRKLLLIGYYLILGRRTLKQASMIHCFSTHEKNYLTKLGINPKKIRIIPSGVNLRDYKKGPNKGYLLFMGRIDRGKGLEHLVRALKGTNERLVLIGKDFGYKQELNQLIKELKVNVEFKGYISQRQKSRLLSECKALVLPSKYESFGRVIIEALASGKPVIATRTGGITDIIKKNLVNYGDVTALRRAIKNPKKEKIDLRKYDWENVYKQTMKMYKQAKKT